MDSETIDGLSYVKLSKHRIKVVISIGNDIKRPGEIAKETELVFSDVSRALKGLKEENIVNCLNEDVNQGRLYQLTELGKKVLDYLE